jgi:hypothetical protein
MTDVERFLKAEVAAGSFTTGNVAIGTVMAVLMAEIESTCRLSLKSIRDCAKNTSRLGVLDSPHSTQQSKQA